MAAKKLTRNPRLSKVPSERRLTVRDHIYAYSARADGAPGREVRVPWLQMRGHWLAAAGFDIRKPVRVRVMQGCLVLTTDDA